MEMTKMAAKKYNHPIDQVAVVPEQIDQSAFKINDSNRRIVSGTDRSRAAGNAGNAGNRATVTIETGLVKLAREYFGLQANLSINCHCFGPPSAQITVSNIRR
jgi:hypothetical protein